MPDRVQREDTTRLLPFRWPVPHRENRTPRVIEIDTDGASEMVAALSSEIARALSSQVHESPRTASDLAEVVGTSVQNVQYHLQKFEEAELVEVVDTWYSSRGGGMRVYGPSDRSFVFYTGSYPGNPTSGEALGRLLGGVGILGIASVLVDRLGRMLVKPAPPTVDAPGTAPANQVEPLLFEFAGATFSPEAVFFGRGLFVHLLLSTVWWSK